MEFGPVTENRSIYSNRTANQINIISRDGHTIICERVIANSSLSHVLRLHID